MGSARGPFGPHRGDSVASVRARSRCVYVSPTHAGGPRRAQRRADRGAAGPSCRVRARGARAPRAPTLRRHAAGRACTGRCGPLLRGRRIPRLARARRGGDSRACGRGHAAGGNRPGRPVGRAWRASLETVLGTLGIPFTIEGRVRLGQTPFGQALLALLRFEWQLGGRRDLYAYLRSPFSGFTRSNVDFLEGRLRGRGVSLRERSRRRRSSFATGSRCRRSRRFGAPSGRSKPCARSPRDAARGARSRGAAGRRVEPSRPSRLRRDRAVLDELDGWRALGGELAADEVLGRARARRGADRLGGRAGPGRGARPGARAHPSLRCRLPARARGGHAAAPRQRRRRSSTTTRAASSTGMRRPGSCGPTPSSVSVTSSTPPARARRGG